MIAFLMTVAFAGREPVLLPADDAVFDNAHPGDVSTDPWWLRYDDPALTAWVETGLTENGDVGAASARVAQARAITWQQVGALMPSVTVDANARLAPLDSFGFGFNLQAPPGVETPELYTQGSATITAQWRLDLWGRQVLTVQASRYDALAAEGDAGAQTLATASRIASAYWDVAYARSQVSVIEEQIRTNEQLLEIVDLRYEVSDTTGTDVLQQQQQLAATRALLPQAQAILQATERQLEALAGGAAADLPSTLPVVPAPPPTGRPRDLLTNRPDLRALDARLDAAHARKLSTQRTNLPSVSLSAQAGQQFIDTFDYQDQQYWNAGAAVSVPLFNGGSTYHAVKAARAAEDSAAHSFQQRCRTAIAEVEGNVVSEALGRENLAAVRAQQAAARTTFEQAERQYADGVGSYLSVLTALASWQQSQLAELQAHRSLLSTQLSLHESLGGSWTNQ